MLFSVFINNFHDYVIRGYNLNIAVLIKQVPDTDDVVWTQNNNIDRTNMESIMNPVDKQAIEAALRIKELNNANVVTLTMGPKKALDILKESIAMGVDDAFLLCDSKFAGSDTLATSKILTKAIETLFPDVRLIICGQSASDGETGQTGPCCGARLNVPCLDNVNEILEITDEYIIVSSQYERVQTVYKVLLPALICINNFIFPPRIPKIAEYIKSQKYDYKVYNMYDINILEDDAGLKGSPTYVSSVYRCEDTRNGKIIVYNQDNLNEIYDEIKKVVYGT